VKLKLVTITGADHSVAPEALLGLKEKFPFVEWGILLSKDQAGVPRYPSLEWLQSLSRHAAHLRLAGHLCGRWMRDACVGNWSFKREQPSLWPMFGRLQLNFHSQPHRIDAERFVPALLSEAADKQVIFQLAEGHSDWLERAIARGANVAGLFDASGGTGRLPQQWPVPNRGWMGYAGGLSPQNVAEQLRRIEAVAGEADIWIDVETRVRSGDDRQFDLEKVEAFLVATRPWVG
jgi:hypothetical protein